ncbi:MAG: replicative DNA helicase [Planctomycetota bacterium]
MSVAPSGADTQQQQLTRVPPQSREAEMCVLGAMILDAGSIDIVVQWLSGEYFYNPAHTQIYDVVVAMSNDRKPIDLVTLRDELARRKVLDAVGGTDYLLALVDGVPNAANIEYYGRIVRDKALLRNLIRTATDLCREAYDSSEDAAMIVDRAEKRIFDIATLQVSDTITEIGDVIQQTFEQLQTLDGSVTGLPTGYFRLDELTSGFQPGEMIIVAARPSMGKTAIALNIAEYMAVDEGRPVLLFSLEMARQQLVQRLLASRTHFDQSLLRRGNIQPDDWTRLQMAAGELEAAPIFIDDSAEITMLQMRAKARRLKARHDIQCIFIDYLQLITPTGNAESRQVQVSEMSRNIKALARELNIPVVTLAQLNRSVEDRVGHRPRMSDLRESGSIEQDADVIGLLHRPDYFSNDAEPNVAELIIDKQRNGPTGIAKLTFLRECTRFENYHAPDEQMV